MNAPLFLCSLQNCGLAAKVSNLLIADFFFVIKIQFLQHSHYFL